MIFSSWPNIPPKIFSTSPIILSHLWNSRCQRRNRGRSSSRSSVCSQSVCSTICDLRSFWSSTSQGLIDQWSLITCTLQWSHFLHTRSQVLLIFHDTHDVHTQIGHVYACLGNERSLCLEDRHRQRLGGRCASSGPDQFSKDLFSHLVCLILHGSSSSPSCLVICNLMSHMLPSLTVAPQYSLTCHSLPPSLTGLKRRTALASATTTCIAGRLSSLPDLTVSQAWIVV